VLQALAAESIRQVSAFKPQELSITSEDTVRSQTLDDDYEDDENEPVFPTWAIGVLSDDDDDADKPVWPTWAVGILSRVRHNEQLRMPVLEVSQGLSRNPKEPYCKSRE
jgi:hypothetical protein